MIHYRIELHDLHAHHYRVTLTVPHPAAAQRVSLPVWIPGSYMVREFSRHLSQLQARQGRRAVGLQQLDKATWQAQCSGGAALTLSYLVYAFATAGCRSANPWWCQNCSTNFEPPTRMSCRLSRSVASGNSRSA